VLGDDLRVQRANPAFFDAFATTPDKTLGRPITEIATVGGDVSGFRSKLHDVLRTGESFSELEIEVAVPDGGDRVLQVNGRRLEEEGDRPVRLLLALQDVTTQRRLEDDLRRHGRELERSNAELEQFAYAASHDLQEPLRMVTSYLQLLERRYPDALDEEAEDFIRYAVDGARRMKHLIDGLLRYSRVGRKEKAFGRVELGALVDGVIDDLAHQIDRLDAEVTREPLPATFGSRSQLRRVLQNLVGNALTYHGDAPPVVRITGERTAPDTVHLTVADEGPGIPPEARERVFQMFQQLDPHGLGKDGTGIGLALCRKIVQRHEGTIWVEEGPQGGSAFHLTLGLSPARAPSQ
jgi:light-regulated signal transduction histidine kinase (bacteriophytochrome)